MTADATTLLNLAETEVSQEIPKEKYGPALMKPPFTLVGGTFNTRDLGLIPGSPLRKGFAFRSGLLSKLSDVGKTQLAGHFGIKRIFDLRSREEREENPDAAIEGVENTWIQSTRPDSRPDLGRFVKGGGEDGYKDSKFVDFQRGQFIMANIHGSE